MNTSKEQTVNTHTRILGPVLALACALFAFTGSAHAQTAVGSFDPGANGDIYALAVQPDGKILVGGSFTMLGGGGTGTTARNYIGRLNPDGSLDTAFNPGAGFNVNAIAVQPDGKILVGGDFSTLGGGGAGTPRSYLGRLNPDGSVDSSFNPGADGPIYSFALQPDGKILVGGTFLTLGTASRSRIGRLETTGAIDSGFNPGANGSVESIAIQPDGRIIVGGLFTMLGGGTGTTPRSLIGRLESNGAIDAGFDPGANNKVEALALQADGKILAGGYFTLLGGGGTGTTARSRIGRLEPNGAIDAGFDPGADGAVFGLAVQTDGKILASGYFSMLGGGGTGTTARSYVGRLHANGTLDAGFDPAASNSVFGIAVLADGNVLLGGNFSAIGGAARSSVALVSNPDAAVRRLAVAGDGSTVTWLRSGGGPEVWRVTFESSTDGTTYTPLGQGTRISGGWQLGGLGLPVSGSLFIRARGFVATGQSSRSASVVESVWPAQPPVRGDFDGDGRADILWRHSALGEVWQWPMDGTTKLSETWVRTVADTGYEIRAVADFTGDGKADILWRHATLGELWLWPMNGTLPLGEFYVGTVDTAYDIVGSGDFDGDGKSDLLWRHKTNGELWIWLVDGPALVSQVYVDQVDTAYVVKGVGDLDADGKADIVWHHATLGETWVWLMDGATRLSQTWIGNVPDTGYQIRGVADFDGNGKADILWHHATLGEVWVWPMDGAARLSETWVSTVPDTGYRIAATGDYDGDGKADLLWHHATRGEVWIWLMDGTTSLSETWMGTVPDVGYQIIR